MSQQEVHMMRKKALGLCLTCGEPAVGVHCLKHTVATRERMRENIRLRRRRSNSPSYVLEQKEPPKPRPGLPRSP